MGGEVEDGQELGKSEKLCKRKEKLTSTSRDRQGLWTIIRSKTDHGVKRLPTTLF